MGNVWHRHWSILPPFKGVGDRIAGIVTANKAGIEYVDVGDHEFYSGYGSGWFTSLPRFRKIEVSLPPIFLQEMVFEKCRVSRQCMREVVD